MANPQRINSIFTHAAAVFAKTAAKNANKVDKVSTAGNEFSKVVPNVIKGLSKVGGKIQKKIQKVLKELTQESTKEIDLSQEGVWKEVLSPKGKRTDVTELNNSILKNSEREVDNIFKQVQTYSKDPKILTQVSSEYFKAGNMPGTFGNISKWHTTNFHIYRFPK